MTDGQLSLLDSPREPLPVRSSDPVTSKAAAKSLNLKARKREVLAAAWVCAPHFVASEVTAVLRERGSRMETGSVRSRLNQLDRDNGMVRKTGGVRKVEVADGGTGQPEQCWTLTDKAWNFIVSGGLA